MNIGHDTLNQKQKKKQQLQKLNQKQKKKHHYAQMLNPIHTTKFSLTSFIRLCVRDTFFLNKESSWKADHTSFEQGKLVRVYMVIKENLTSNWNQHHEIPPQSSHSCYCRQGNVVQPYKRANNICQGKNLRKKSCSLYTRASKPTKELVKENLVACAGL